MKKPTLYALLTNKESLLVEHGDSINEIRSLRILSEKFDVYYNNFPLESQTDAGKQASVGPNREYDFYYIRNNPSVFESIKDQKVLSFAYPYSQSVFKDSHALVVLNENWKRHLLGIGVDSERKIQNVYEGERPKIRAPIIVVGQSKDDHMANAVASSKASFNLKVKTTNARFIFGYYGNLSKSLYPYKAFAAIERLASERPKIDTIIALAGRFRRDSQISFNRGLLIGQLPYDLMPALHDLTLANLTNESELNHCLGNQKVIDSICRGVPIMCQKLDTFVEMLGEDYPCLYESENDAYEIARKLVLDEDFREHTREVSITRSKWYDKKAVIERFLAQPELGLL